MFQALLILLAAATPGAAADNAKQSPQPAEKNHFESVKQICEAMPSTPNHSLNDVALQVACEEANKWLQKNAVGAAVQVAGTVSSLRRQSGPTVFNPKQHDNRPQIFLHLGLQPHAAMARIHPPRDVRRRLPCGFPEELEPCREGRSGGRQGDRRLDDHLLGEK